MSKPSLFRQGKKIGTAIVGGIVILVGILLIPYPGPGWLIVFAGFAILSTEFTFAAKALAWLKERYNIWEQWVRRQPIIVSLAILGLTGLVVLVTLWLINAFGVIDTLFNLGQDWVYSPFFRK